MARLTRWKIGEVLGRPRHEWLESWISSGLLPPPGPDGLWEADALERAEHARRLGSLVRPLAPRALLLHRDGFPVATDARQRAVAYVLAHITRPRHKMSQVLWELRALASGFQPPRPRSRILIELELPADVWPSVPAAASPAIFDRWYQWADLVENALAHVGQAKDIPVSDPMPYHERLALALVVQLLDENHVRNRLGLPPRAPRYALTIDE